MKIFISCLTTVAILLGVNESNSLITTRMHATDLIPAKIVDKKKIPPLKVPDDDCIVIRTEGDAAAFEKHAEECFNRYNWLRITFEQGAPPL